MMKNLESYEGMLLIVDMVNGFLKKGVLHDPNIGRIVPRIIELINEAHEKGYLVVFIDDTHEKDSVEHRRFPGLHSVRGSGEELIIDELSKYVSMDDTIIIEKNSTSFMEAPGFRKLVQAASNIKNVEIVGCCTDICVFNGSMGLANYYDQWNRLVDIIVHQDAIATFGEATRQCYIAAACLLMQQQGIQLVNGRKISLDRPQEKQLIKR